MLADDHGCQIEAVAHKGDTMEAMAYSGGQFDDFTRLLEKPRPGGGCNPAFGRRQRYRRRRFAILHNHAASGVPPPNDEVVNGVVNVRVRNAYAFLILRQAARIAQ